MTSERDCYQAWISSLKDTGIDHFAAWILVTLRPFRILLAQFLNFASPLLSLSSHSYLPQLIGLFEDEQALDAFSAVLLGEEVPS